MADSIATRRIKALRGVIDQNGLAGALISRPEHIFYFTGIDPGPAQVFLLVTPRKILAVSPFPLADFQTVPYKNYDIHKGWHAARNAARALEISLEEIDRTDKCVGVELSYLPGIYLQTIQQHARQVFDLEENLWKIRRIKDATEIAQIEANVAANDAIFKMVQGSLRPGIIDTEIWTRIYLSLCQYAGGPVRFEGDLGVGASASNPDAKPSGQVIKEGDNVFVDVYTASHGYYADTTRVFCLGQADSRQREIHAVLMEALSAGETQLAEGLRPVMWTVQCGV